MGAWGAGSFENDDALDWAAEIAAPGDVGATFARLEPIAAAFADGKPIAIEADLACALVAAAETVAMMMGRRIDGFPEALAKTLADADAPGAELVGEAQEALSLVIAHSELAELWAEDVTPGEENVWQVEMTALIERLNPDIATEPWSAEEIEEAAGGPVTLCCFCNKPIAEDELFGLNIHDYRNRTAFRRGMFFHLACLNARLHHQFMIQDFRFDPDALPDID
ncbi:DUF4259 domain-containing protein [Parasphingopyxis sp.]|uniref:DUF4259 domain-containing protein n=1 Tax=Parasphingopyxis sp. TaxID=1920299 RepID=UPI00260E4A7C|nr:DUF4259 domain-containing protein [Parasphingopyxis sp.]